jgi:hypothetical protein
VNTAKKSTLFWKRKTQGLRPQTTSYTEKLPESPCFYCG